ncbi:pyrroline-5-carboxylate reductase [Streptococcus sp. zg-JUN1979]|uniref:pyrroline-5-carboxylate reductase n=1 Tax=Streptococcus sp. zg-JUN1979 TaxID=3391450 RepID=UPI0039A5CC97
MKIGFIGVGKMASAIIKALKHSNHELILSGSSLKRSKELATELGIPCANSHQELIDTVDLVVFGIKPQLFESVLADLTIDKPIMSMAAGISLERLDQLTQAQLPLIRIMPNINAQILESSTAICANAYVSDALFQTCLDICNTFGKTFAIAEKDFDTFTALAGSSPAYIYLFIEALTKAGLKHGFSKDTALNIVAQTVFASSKQLLNGQETPNHLIDTICSPGGTTIAGLLDLEKNNFTASVVSSIDATITKAKDL